MLPLAVILYVFLLVTCRSQCIFTDGSNRELDLRCLQDSVLSIFVDNGPTDQTFYNYSICENALNCTFEGRGPIGMMVQYGYPNQDVCYVNARFDGGTTRPTYNVTTQTWTFQYTNGDSNPFCLQNRSTILNFVCNASIEEYEIVFANEISSCRYEMTIATKYGCEGEQCVTSTTTLGPADECIFSTNDGQHTLDLSLLKSRLIDKASDDDNTLQYLYTPCTNNVNAYCEGISNMVEIANLTSLSCYKYLARWDNRILPIYNDNPSQWIFTYQNGELCQGLNEVLRIIWNCDEEAGEAQVTSATRESECIYKMEISSKYACD